MHVNKNYFCEELLYKNIICKDTTSLNNIEIFHYHFKYSETSHKARPR